MDGDFNIGRLSQIVHRAVYSHPVPPVLSPKDLRQRNRKIRLESGFFGSFDAR